LLVLSFRTDCLFSLFVLSRGMQHFGRSRWRIASLTSALFGTVTVGRRIVGMSAFRAGRGVHSVSAFLLVSRQGGHGPLLSWARQGRQLWVKGFHYLGWRQLQKRRTHFLT
jgi:hypothetical protein